MSFEVYANNLDYIDKFGLKDVSVDKKTIYKGHIGLVEKQDPEDKDIVPPLAAAVLGINNIRAPLNRKVFYNTWIDLDAQELYLETKPTCYFIVGKPGAGAYILGESLSKKLNCIHLCPKNLIQDEIDQKSPTGKCLDFNMKHNKVCAFETILALLKSKVESPTVKHRGYVISGIPLITSGRRPHYLINGLYSEEATTISEELLYDVVCNLKKKKTKPPKKDSDSHTSTTSEQFLEQEGEETQEEEEEEDVQEEFEEEEPPVELPKFLLDSCSNVVKCHKPYLSTKKATILRQIQTVTNIDLKPDIIIYITCPDIDIVTKKSHMYFNYKNSQQAIEPFITKLSTDLRWPSVYTSSDYLNPYDVHSFNPKYNCRQPINFTERSIEQMCNYKDNLHPFIEKKIKDFNPKYVIKLDARTSVHQMMHHVTEILLLMNIPPVLIPEPLYLEEPPEDLEEFWRNIEDIKAIHSDSIHFRRYPSPWLNRCPVELKNRRSVKGKPRFSVMFFRHVYLLSSLYAMIVFCRNPRPFLKLHYLEPTCRVIVTGTKSSGKTMVSECLSWIFDAPIICYKKFLETEKQRKYESFAKSILSEIIATIEDSRFIKWQRKELDRVSDLNAWYDQTLKIMTDYIILLRHQRAKENKVLEEEQIATERELTTEENKDHIGILKHIADLKNQLSFLPMLEDLDECERVVAQQEILNYAPLELSTVTEKPDIPVLGDEDVTEAVSTYIIANQLQKELEPNVDEIMSEIGKVILNLDEKCQKDTNFLHTYGKYIIDGFPSDPEYWGSLRDAKLMPDYTIGLIENKELDADVIEYYTNINNCSKNHGERYVLAKDPFVQIKLQKNVSHKSNYLNMQFIANNSNNKILESTTKTSQPNDGNDEINSETQFATSLSESIEKFREDWDGIKVNLEDCAKSFIEIELENKSDIQIIEEVLLKIRKSYFLTAEVNEDGEPEDQDNTEDETPKDLLSYNDTQFFCDTYIYCPISYYDYGTLWEGKPEFSLKYDSKIYNFSKEEYVELFQKDITKYQTYSKIFKKLPAIKICVIGCTGSGKTTVAKLIAKELGLLHIDFEEVLNDYLMPRHFKKVGRRYENSFSDVPIDEEGVIEFQMDEENENLMSDILSNETELRRMVYNYFERGSPVLSILMQKLIKRLWLEDPFVKAGFVLDGYPKIPADVEDMISCTCIPDLVIDLQCNVETAVSRLSPIMMKTWRTQLKHAQGVAKEKHQNEIKEWMNFITKSVVVKLIFNEILDNLPMSNTDVVAGISTTSVIMDAHPTGSLNVDPNLFKIYNDLIEEHPEPRDTSEWEKANDVRERIDSRIESIFETDDENIQALKDMLSDQRIKTISIDSTKSLNKVIRVALLKLATLRNRNESFFEQTFIVKTDIADMLLSQGFCFLSKFSRMCPVYIYNNPKTILNFYKVSRRRGKIFPVVHRSHIYFIDGEDSLHKFRTNPLIYIVSKAIKSYIEYPLRLAVIGPPKSGKSSLAAKLAKEYGLMCISRGKAIRHVLENMPWTELASLISKDLSQGKCVESDLIMKAVQTVAIDHRTVTQGIVLDGFPYSRPEAMELVKDGLYPIIIFDIASDKETILHNSQNNIYYNILKLKPPYSHSFIEYRYRKWQESSYKIRNWVANDYQNLYNIDGNESKWRCLQDANDRMKDTLDKVHYYLANVKTKVVPAKVMCISSEIFKQNMSPFKNMCPLCLRQNVLKHSEYPVDRTGIVQFRNKYYWICSKHLETVLKHPRTSLSNQNITISEQPLHIKHFSGSLVYEKGVCIVTYAENLPAQKIVRGDRKFAVSYHGNRYLLCSRKCLHKFLSKPHLYYDIVVFKETQMFPPLALERLPDLGYLEQTVSNAITEACCSLNVLRPKYPGLSFQISGLIYLGLYMKTHNPLINTSVQSKYVRALKVFDARSKLMLDVGLRLRSMDNPFAKYPKCSLNISGLNESVASLERRQASIKASSDVGSDSIEESVVDLSRRVPVPDERYDYLCEFHKPVSKVPAFLNVVDIAGLVRGAAEGQGLGNAFLSHIKACDAIFNLCRAFDDEDVIHVDGDVNPVRDLETIGEELRLKDEEQLMQNIEKLDRAVNRGNDKKLKPEYDALMKIKTILVDEKKHIRFGDWSAADIEILNKYLFLTSKPALYLVNLSEKDYTRKKNKWLPKLKEWIDKNDPGAPLIPFSGALETKLLDMDPEERKAYLKEQNITSALDKIIVQGYKALQLEYFFTAGADEVKAWTIQKGTKAPQAAGRIHTDFEKGFIMAEVMHFKDFKEEGTEAACKAAGKYRQQGRNYVVEDGDIIFFKFNAGAGLKDAKKK